MNMDAHCMVMFLGYNSRSNSTMRKSRLIHWGNLEEEEEEETEEQELEGGIQSVDSLSSTPIGVETPHVIDLRKQQHRKSEKPLYQRFWKRRKNGSILCKREEANW